MPFIILKGWFKGKMAEPIDISKLKGIEKLVAQFCDINKDGKLEKTDKFDEISLFNQEFANFNKWNSDKTSIFRDKYIAPRDATRVAEPFIMEDRLVRSVPEFKSIKPELDKAMLCKKMQQKWCNAFKGSPLKTEFFTKLYDVMKTLNVKIDEAAWDKEKYASPEEQAMDEVIAIFAGESRLNPKTIGKVKGASTFYGLFQLSKQGLGVVKQWAKEHPEVAGMKNIKQNMTLQAFRNLKGEQQLDYLIAYIGASREASNIDENEELTPAKLWSMIKLPNLDENNPKKKARRERTIVQKQDSIQAIFRNNKIPYGIV